MRIKHWIWGVSGLVVLLLVSMALFAGFLTDLWWFSSLGMESVFWTNYQAQYGLWVAGFVVFVIMFLANVRAGKGGISIVPADPRLREFLDDFGRFLPLAIRIVAAVFGIVFAAYLSSSWKEMLTFLKAVPFGATDPVFGHDIGFYVFTLPFWEIIRQWILWAVLITLAGVISVGFLRQAIFLDGNRPKVSPALRCHASILGSVAILCISVGYWFDRFEILNASRSSSFHGAAYADLHATLPTLVFLAAVTALCAIGLLLVGFGQKPRFFLWPLVGLFLVAQAVALLYPPLIQKFVVSPMEQSKELPYIARNLEFTRRAYALETVNYKSIDPRYSLTAKDVEPDNATMQNVMLWDYRPLTSTLDQLQVIRPYYGFPDVDIDRYVLPNGDYRQVMLGARELDPAKLPANARTWVNTNFAYTHGYGITMTPVNKITEEGFPDFFLRDIPPQSPVGIQLPRPEIYFGEKTDAPVVVRGIGIQEFDYPLGDSNQSCIYAEDAGVVLDSFFKKMVFAFRLKDINFLFSGYIGSQSRILYHRNIHERIRKLAPFLEFDADPYLVAAGGRLTWICDAYTTTNRYPYAKPFKGDQNYIRNSVKVTVDAYNGKSEFYVCDPKDPIIRVFGRIYPALFKPFSAMPPELKQHIRYPQDLFDIQAAILEAYHIEDPKVFYNKEDIWSVANEKLDNKPSRMESYYALIRLPGEEKEEFILMSPYTPANRDNMIAWLCARSDGKNYGKMLIYKFPKSDLTYGPMQIAARIDQDPNISQQLTLWNQQGSSVTRGNLLVIPVRNEVVYIQPIYLQATTGKLPELKRIIVVFGNRIAMENTLEAALRGVFGEIGEAPALPRPAAMTETTSAGAKLQAPPSPGSLSVSQEIRQLAKEARDSYDRATAFLKEGNWSKYGEEINALKKNLDDLVKAAEK